MRQVYLDNNATTPLHPEVKRTMIEALELYGNASSVHTFGREAREAIEQARAAAAAFLGVSEKEIVFTSGGSESNNTVIKCLPCGPVMCSRKGGSPAHVITSQVEHPSVYETCKCLEAAGHKVTYVPVDRYGMVNPADVEKALHRDTALITIMYANNEVGTVQPIKEIGEIAQQHGVLFHTDAVQAVGKIPFNIPELGVSALSLSGHKLYGPKGIGVLYAKKGVKLCPLIHGGHQEHGRRAGTDNNLGIIGLGKAMALARAEMPEQPARIARLRDRLEKGILERIDDVQVNGHPTQRLPNTSNISFKYVEGESILLSLDAEGIGASTGSACTSGTLSPSHVLIAMGVPVEVAHGSVRFSLGRETSEEDIDYVLEALPAIIARLRRMSPLGRGRTWKGGAHDHAHV